MKILMQHEINRLSHLSSEKQTQNSNFVNKVIQPDILLLTMKMQHHNKRFHISVSVDQRNRFRRHQSHKNKQNIVARKQTKRCATTLSPSADNFQEIFQERTCIEFTVQGGELLRANTDDLLDITFAKLLRLLLHNPKVESFSSQTLLCHVVNFNLHGLCNAPTSQSGHRSARKYEWLLYERNLPTNHEFFLKYIIRKCTEI